jgi:hypothetical protein
MENNTTETLTDLVSRVAVALEAAVVEHGPEAVDLVLTVYQIDAVKSLILGALLLLPFIWFRSCYRFVRSWEVETDGMTWVVGFGLFIFLTPAAFGSAVFSPAHWIAAFGNPELLIATRALEAAGAL